MKATALLTTPSYTVTINDKVSLHICTRHTQLLLGVLSIAECAEFIKLDRKIIIEGLTQDPEFIVIIHFPDCLRQYLIKLIKPPS